MKVGLPKKIKMEIKGRNFAKVGELTELGD